MLRAEGEPRTRARTAFTWTASAAFVALAPLASLVAMLLQPSGHFALFVACGGSLALAGAALARSRGVATALAVACLSLVVGLGASDLLERPALAYAVGLVGIVAIGVTRLAPFDGLSPTLDRSDGYGAALRGSAYASLTTWAVILVANLGGDLRGRVVATASLAVSVGYAVVWARANGARFAQRARLALGSVIGGIVMAVVLGRHPNSSLTALALSVALCFWLVPTTSEWWASLLEHPSRLLVVSFALLCGVGAAVLAIPAASTRPGGAGLLDAAFTSVSAVCVTGLAVLDTPKDYSFFGQAAILVAIQAGGLGIMTFYSAALSALGRRMSLRHESAIASALAIEDRGKIIQVLGRILRVTFVTEAVGAVGLIVCFYVRHGDRFGMAVWRGTFTAVSAFCNAGFALQSDSLIPYQSDPWVLHIVAALIVAGGLSPAVVVAIPSLVAKRRVPMQVRLILSSSAVLLLGCAVMIALIEWTVSLGGLSYADRLHNAWFQSVTLRTAGFNSIDIAATTPATQAMFLVAMFIGGAPGGTAGGVKTTTAAVLALAVFSALNRRAEIVAYGRRIGHITVYKAAAVAMLGLASAVVAIMALQLTQHMPPDVAVFEAVSALGTVGLSTGGTALLDNVGKAIVMICMFAGRLGPLTLLLFLTENEIQSPWAFPEEDVDIG